MIFGSQPSANDLHCDTCDEDGHRCEMLGDAPEIEFVDGFPVAEPIETTVLVNG